MATAPLQFVGVTQAQGTMLIATGAMLVVYAVLVELDSFNWGIFLSFVAVDVILATNAVGFNVLGYVASSPAFVFLILGVLFLGYQAIQAWRESNKTVLNIEGE
jgi:flagellar biosynthesis component FlhA